jgi:hypothetical protein
MRTLLPLGALLALTLAGCSSDLTAPAGSTPSFATGSCAGGANQPGNQPCNGQQGGGNNNNNNSNNPPATAP